MIEAAVESGAKYETKDAVDEEDKRVGCWQVSVF